MTLEARLRLIAGAFVMASVLLGMYMDPRFLWFTLFVGANLFQSAFTGWCPMMTILRHWSSRQTRASVTGAVALIAAGAVLSAAPQGRGMQAPMNYNVATETTLAGTIDEVQTMSMGASGQGGVHLMLKTSTETIRVDLGPSWFMTQEKYTLVKGDAISVVGSRVKMGTTDTLIAREIKKGDQTMTFRDAKGFPKWSDRGRGARPGV